MQLQDKKVNKYTVLAILFLGYITSYLDRMVMSVAIPFVGADFNLSTSELGVVLSSFFAGYALMQMPGGWLADKFGSKPVMVCSIILWSIFTLFTGFAWSLFSLLVIRFFFGIFEGGFPAASTKSLTEHFEKKELSRAEAVMISSNSLGAALAPLFAAPLIIYIGWRNMFLVLSLLGFIVAVLIWKYIHSPKQKQEVVHLSNKPKIRDLMKTKELWKLVIMWFCLAIVIWGFSSWLPSYLINVRDLPLIKAGILASLPFFAGTIAQLLGGWLLDTFFIGKEKYFAFVVELLGALFLYLMFTTPTLGLAMTYQVLAAFFLYLGVIAIWSFPIKMFPSTVMGSTAGIINFGGQLAGFLSPMVMGFIISASGGSYTIAFGFLVIAAIVSAFVGLTIDNKKTEAFEEKFVSQTH